MACVGEGVVENEFDKSAQMRIKSSKSVEIHIRHPSLPPPRPPEPVRATNLRSVTQPETMGKTPVTLLVSYPFLVVTLLVSYPLFVATLLVSYALFGVTLPPLRRLPPPPPRPATPRMLRCVTHPHRTQRRESCVALPTPTGRNAENVALRYPPVACAGEGVVTNKIIF